MNNIPDHETQQATTDIISSDTFNIIFVIACTYFHIT